MITISEWKAMSGKEQTLWLEVNKPASNSSISKRIPIHGVGINDAGYMVRLALEGKRIMCPAYSAWSSIMARAYSEKLHGWNGSYVGVIVNDEWHRFSSFRAWWLKNQTDGYALDKDILTNGREYGEESCVFIPQWLNNFTVFQRKNRGDAPIGVTFAINEGKYKAQCSNPISGKNEHLGYFSDKFLGFLAWRDRKLEIALLLKDSMDSIDLRIYPRVVEIINNAK